MCVRRILRLAHDTVRFGTGVVDYPGGGGLRGMDDPSRVRQLIVYDVLPDLKIKTGAGSAGIPASVSPVGVHRLG